MRRGYLKVAQLRRDGDWQPAPKAMRNLMSEARKVGLDVVLEPTPVYPSVGEGDPTIVSCTCTAAAAFEERAKDVKHLHFNLDDRAACCSPTPAAARSSSTPRSASSWSHCGREEKLKLEPIPLDGRAVMARS